MTGVPRHIAEHRLNIREGCLPIRQKKRGQAPKTNKAILDEVEKLVDAKIMKEVHYHSWLSNPVMVKKHDGSWRMWGFKDHNKACPKMLSTAEKIEKKCTRKSDFRWTQEADVAFRQMKKLIAELPMLAAPKEREELIMYLAAAKEAISAVLMTEREGKQMAVYFVSRALRGPEINYTPMEKLVLALLSASRWLKRYFEAHTIVVITDQLIKQLLSNSEITERMLKWKFELEGYDIQYKPMISIQGQILADFIVERLEEESSNELMAEPKTLLEPWNLFIDGSSCIDGFEAEQILKNRRDGIHICHEVRFEATNNEAEYEALIAGLRIAEQIGEFSIKQIPLSENKKADAISKIASTSFAHLSKQVLVEELKEKSINEKEVLVIVEEEGHTLMTPICEYLTKEILSEDKRKARAVAFDLLRDALSLTGNARVWFDKLPKESIDSYEDLRAAFRENYLQQTKHIKDPVEIHHIKQRDGESTEDFMERYKAEVLDMEGAPECMKISGFMHGITHPELIKRSYEKIPRSMDEVYRVTTSFLQGEVAAFSHSRKKAPTP
ncbi:reverse transcriptase domain-containing protein [Tanacetum coccineum]|uniref:Reverse transcriptase domain-containing protein n=1 Tax=Tanacetum coccineum TaxID=301880 RepID=A0ABQ4XHU4_9ASTR